MPLNHTRIFGAVLLSALTACTPSRTDTNAESVAASYRNPSPKEAYTITMTLNGAPGPFAFMQGLAQYDVVNRECLSPPKSNPGGHTAPVPTDDVEIPLRKISDTEYVATVYADQMLDQDFAGRGLCHWKLIQFRVHMKATGAPGETLFIPSIPDDKLLSSSNEIVYFNTGTYPQVEGLDDYPDTGSRRSEYGASIRDEDLFDVKFASIKDGTK